MYICMYVCMYVYRGGECVWVCRGVVGVCVCMYVRNATVAKIGIHIPLIFIIIVALPKIH